MKKNSILVKTMLMSILTAGSLFSFTSCSDELEAEQASLEETELTAKTRSIETAADRYNINVMDPIEQNNFDRKHWRNQTSIYLRVSELGRVDEDIKDFEGRTGYQKVVLPWAEGSFACKTNLPAGFCKDITPENGWDLVANYCGERGNADAHYFVLYNKYMGKLRYFYYIPNYVKLNGAADHNIEVHMQKGMAEHSIFGYAVPTKRSLSKPEKTGAMQGGYYTQYISPWTATVSKLGQMAPMEGWYAFDVDLSVYRGKENTMKEDELVQTTLRGYNTTNVDMYGKLKAGVTGNINMEKCCVNNQSGAFGPIEGILGQIGGVKSFFEKAKSVYTSATSGDILGFYEGTIGLAKQGCDLVGIDYGATSSGFDGYQGEVNMQLDGTLDFSGKFQTENVIQGLANITQPMSDYNFTADNHMGEGIWNIEDAPVVYVTNAYTEWCYNGSDGIRCDFQDIKSPFGGQNFHEKPYVGRVCYFDPTSIKLVLNPNIFSEDEIKNAKVYATCGVRKNAQFGSTEDYRSAQGLKPSTVASAYDFDSYYNRPTTEAPFDAMSGFKDPDGSPMKAGMKFDVKKVGGVEYGLFGRGDADYLIEPLTLHGYAAGKDEWLPAYEVTVTVVVEHDKKQMVFSRNYLPEFVEISREKMPNYNTPSYVFNKPANYDKALFCQQAKHMGALRKWIYRTLSVRGPMSGNPLWWTVTVFPACIEDKVPESHSHASLFDGSYTTAWHLDEGCKDDQDDKSNLGVYDGKRHVYWCEFKTGCPEKPYSYNMVTGRAGSEAPTEWAIYGKLRENDKWTLLDYRKSNILPDKATTKKELSFQKLSPGHENKEFKYYRLEIYEVKDNDEMSLAEFSFNYML